MRNIKNISAIAIIIFPLLLFSQENKSKPFGNSFSVSVESPLFFKSWYEENGNVGFLNFELFDKRKENFANSYSLGLLLIANLYGEVYVPQQPIFYFQYAAVFGKKRHFFELGTGLVVPEFLLNLRFGYRLNLGKRILFRAAYTPSVYLEQHIDSEEYPSYTVFNGLSLSLGYRFGIKTSKEKWDNNWKWLSGMQLNFQPFFKNYKGYEGYYGEVDLELLLYTINDISIKGLTGFGYGSLKSDYERFAYNSIPFGVRLLVGRKNHFPEMGIKSAWIPIGGNSDGTFFTLQPELGYRFCPGKHFMARVAYTPYWWLSNNSGKEYVEQKFVHSATIGIGWRFH